MTYTSAAAEVAVRPMREADLDTALDVTEGAFKEFIGKLSGRPRTEPMFSRLLGSYRIALDPEGCHVAERDGDIIGVNFSLLRGTLGWFGPLAVRPEAQGLGVAQRLVVECLRSAERRGSRLMGLETFSSSPLHIHLYQKLGFRPSWTGISYRGPVGGQRMPPEVEIDGAVPSLDYLYPGLNPAKDAATTRNLLVGSTFTLDDGFAVCHVANTLWADPLVAYVPLIVARDRGTFDLLLQACAALAREGGKSELITQVPGSSWQTQAALLEHGYRPGTAALRMKRGEHANYDGGDFFYCDDWH